MYRNIEIKRGAPPPFHPDEEHAEKPHSWIGGELNKKKAMKKMRLNVARLRFVCL